MQGSQVPVGYKLTEVGVIPEDWELKSIGDISSVSSGGTPSRSNPLYWNGNIPWITTTQIDFNIIDRAEQFITQNGLDNSAAKIFPENTLLMAMYGQGKTRGKVAILNIKASTNQACAAILLNRNANYFYIFHYLSNKYEVIRNLSNTGNQENLNGFIIKSIQIPIPPLPEQEAIACVLSDTDALITSLDKLIAKKRDIKQAAMQQLLTGKQRLEGFSGEWAIKQLRDVLKVRHGKSQHNVIASDGKYPILATGGEIGRTNAYLYNKPSVLIGRKGTIDSPQYIDSPFWTIDTLFFTEIFDSAFPKFIYYKFNMINWRGHNEASGVPSLNASTIESIEFNCPKIEEQQAIAKVLSDMDSEISALEQRRDKTKALKQAMMQELLTGRIRLR